MISPWWSVILTVVGATGIYLTTRKLWVGFAVGLAVQILWVIYALSTNQWGFIGSALLYGTVHTIGLRRWLQEKKETEVASDRTP